MSNVSDNYVKLLYKRYRYFATWFPNVKIQLGDVGIAQGAQFKRLTTLKQLGISFSSRVGTKTIAFNDELTSGINVQTTVGGDIGLGSALPLGKTEVIINFVREGEFLFHSLNCYVDEIEDKAAVGESLIALREKWDPEWSVVDSIVRAGSTTILLANSRDARMELNAKTSVDLSNLANPELGLEVSAKYGDVTQFLAEKGLTPLFNLSRFHQSWIDWLLGKPKTIHFGGPLKKKPDVPILTEVIPELP